MRHEKVSVILPTYNRAHCLEKAVQCVLQQTYEELELIIVDDASTDGTGELVAQMGDKRIRYYCSNKNQGASGARNYGMEKAECAYIAFQDSDDYWHAGKLEKQMRALQAQPEAGFCYHKMRYHLGGESYAILPAEEIAFEKKNGTIYEQLLYDNMVSPPILLARLECIRDTGLFDTEFKALEDYDYALRMAKKYRAVFVDEVLLEASYSTTGVSGNAVNYLLASCRLIQKYKADYQSTGTLNHRLEVILRDASAIGMQEQFIRLLEQILKMGD